MQNMVYIVWVEEITIFKARPSVMNEPSLLPHIVRVGLTDRKIEHLLVNGVASLACPRDSRSYPWGLVESGRPRHLQLSLPCQYGQPAEISTTEGPALGYLCAHPGCQATKSTVDRRRSCDAQASRLGALRLRRLRNSHLQPSIEPDARHLDVLVQPKLFPY